MMEINRFGGVDVKITEEDYTTYNDPIAFENNNKDIFSSNRQLSLSHINADKHSVLHNSNEDERKSDALNN